MEIKKTPKADLENKKGLFLEIGLIIALGVCILMFSWSQKEKVVVKMTDDVAIVEQEIVEITRQEEPPKAPQAKTISVTADILRVVKDDAKITTINAAYAELDRSGDYRSFIETIASKTDFWGRDLNQVPGFTDAAAAYLKSIEDAGVAAAVRKLLEA